MIPSSHESSLVTAARAATAAFIVCRVAGGSKRAAFAAALDGWHRFRPADGEMETHENVVPLVLAIEEMGQAMPH